MRDPRSDENLSGIPGWFFSWKHYCGEKYWVYFALPEASNKLPLENAPAMIGLHENVNFLYNIERAEYIRKSLSKCQAPEEGIFRRRGIFPEEINSMERIHR